MAFDDDKQTRMSRTHSSLSLLFKQGVELLEISSSRRKRGRNAGQRADADVNDRHVHSLHQLERRFTYDTGHPGPSLCTAPALSLAGSVLYSDPSSGSVLCPGPLPARECTLTSTLQKAKTYVPKAAWGRPRCQQHSLPGILTFQELFMDT